MLPEVRTVAFVVNRSKPQAKKLVERLMRKVESLGGAALLIEDYPMHRGQLEGVQLCCTVGGDGTLLGAVEEAAHTAVPLLAINTGNLGFLALDYNEDLEKRLEAIFRGDYHTETRMLLSCKSSSGQAGLALNDVVLKCPSACRLGHFFVCADGEELTHIDGDGLIIATPTGSTAYNLSAGGPLVHPKAEVILLTPICSHRLSDRTILLPPSTSLSLRFDKAKDVPHVSLDGRSFDPGKAPVELVVTVSGQSVRLICSPDYNFVSVLRRKLKGLQLL